MGKLKRYGVAITPLEPDLDSLLRGEAIRMRSELLSQPVVTTDGIDLMPEDKVELLAGAEEPDEKNPQYEVIYSVMAMNTPLPSAWEGALSHEKNARNGTAIRLLRESSTDACRKAIRQTRGYT